MVRKNHVVLVIAIVMISISIGEAYATKGDKSIAQRYYRKALEKDSLNANAIEILRYLK